MHWHRNMNGMIPLWNFNSKALLVRASNIGGIPSHNMNSVIHALTYLIATCDEVECAGLWQGIFC